MAGRLTGQGVGNQVFSVGAFVAGLARERLGWPQMLPEGTPAAECEDYARGEKATAIKTEAKKVRDELRAQGGSTDEFLAFFDARVKDYLARKPASTRGPTKAEMAASLAAAAEEKAKLEAKLARLQKKVDGK
jgi:hypothetical protein